MVKVFDDQIISMFGMGCTGINQCGPLQVSTMKLMLTSAFRISPLDFPLYYTVLLLLFLPVISLQFNEICSWSTLTL